MKKIQIHHFQGSTIAELISDQIEINNSQDALDLMAECSYMDAAKIVIHEKNITAGFFDLSTCIAGDILQKFSNYNVRLAIIGDFSKFNSKSLKDFIYESNKVRRVIFAGSREEAIKNLT